MSIRQPLAAALFAALFAALLAVSPFVNAQAAPLEGDGTWSEFSVSEVLTGNLNWADFDGNPLSFDFSIGAGQQGVLTIVDTGFIGDTFNIFNGATLLGGTSSVPIYTLGSEGAVVDFDAALANSSFSRASFNLGAGTYSISGLLTQSTLLALNDPLNATTGGIRLEVSPVPEPSSLALMVAGLGLLVAGARRRAR